jgi:hypothetical protein
LLGQTNDWAIGDKRGKNAHTLFNKLSSYNY